MSKTQKSKKRFPNKRKAPLPKAVDDNVSKMIKNGTMIRTRDEYFADHNGYKKEKYKDNNILYREAFVIDTNSLDEMILIKAQSNGKYCVINLSGQKEHYNLFVKDRDNEGKPIRLGTKFKKGERKYSISEKDADTIREMAMQSSHNKKCLIQLKHRGLKKRD